MVSNLFSIRFDDSNTPSTEFVVSGRDAELREYFAGPENALLNQVIATEFASDHLDFPLVMFGQTGVGKTHLIRGLADRYEALHDDAVIRLLSGADFCREFSQAHEVGSLDDVRRQLRNLDFLALDDVQALADKPYAQQELLSLLDSLKDSGTKVVFTSNRSPSELPFSPALKSRLSGGLSVPIRLPARTTRRAFISRFATECELALPEDIVDRLADVTPGSIPELRGLILQLQQLHLKENQPLDADLLFRVITERVGDHLPGVRQIIKKVARYFGLTAAELTGPSRRQTTVLARDTAIFLTRHVRKDSFEQIGTYFGGRDHSTIMHAFQKITKKRHDSLVNAAIVELTQRLGLQHHDF